MAVCANRSTVTTLGNASESEYKTILAKMRQMRASSPPWHAVLYNCNAFVGDVAKYMGLKTPANTLQMPKDFINGIKKSNGGRKELAAQWHEAPESTSNPGWHYIALGHR